MREAFEKFAETASNFGAGAVRHHRDTLAEYQRTVKTWGNLWAFAA